MMLTRLATALVLLLATNTNASAVTYSDFSSNSEFWSQSFAAEIPDGMRDFLIKERDFWTAEDARILLGYSLIHNIPISFDFPLDQSQAGAGLSVKLPENPGSKSNSLTPKMTEHAHALLDKLAKDIGPVPVGRVRKKTVPGIRNYLVREPFDPDAYCDGEDKHTCLNDLRSSGFSSSGFNPLTYAKEKVQKKKAEFIALWNEIDGGKNTDQPDTSFIYAEKISCDGAEITDADTIEQVRSVLENRVLKISEAQKQYVQESTASQSVTFKDLQLSQQMKQDLLDQLESRKKPVEFKKTDYVQVIEEKLTLGPLQLTYDKDNEGPKFHIFKKLD